MPFQRRGVVAMKIVCLIRLSKSIPVRSPSPSTLLPLQLITSMSTTKRDSVGGTPASAKRTKTDVSKKLSAAKADIVEVPELEECGFAADDLLQLRLSLLNWYDETHRILPWRRNSKSRLAPDLVAKAAKEGSHPAPSDLPLNQFIYYVWVCEIMSQQTQVARAAEYFKRWIAKWPDVKALATASQEEVNELWAGLGYYRRAKYLLDGAKYIVNDLSGEFPRTSKELQKIPGVGAYTSNAIASIACGEQVAVVDGNVIRVLARVRRLSGDPRSAGMTKLFADLASQALDPERPGDFNQAMMELGARFCVPNTVPACSDCPLKRWCQAYQAERQYRKAGGEPVAVTDYPTKTEKAEKREESVAVTVLRVVDPGSKVGDHSLGKFLLMKRPQGGLLAGLWEFPLLQVAETADAKERHAATNKYLKKLLGLDLAEEGDVRVRERKDLGSTVHVFSHIRMTMHVEKLTLEGEMPEAANGNGDDSVDIQWLTAEELGGKGLSSGVKKVHKMYLTAGDKEKSAAAHGIKNYFKPTKNQS